MPVGRLGRPFALGPDSDEGSEGQHQVGLGDEGLGDLLIKERAASSAPSLVLQAPLGLPGERLNSKEILLEVSNHHRYWFCRATALKTD